MQNVVKSIYCLQIIIYVDFWDTMMYDVKQYSAAMIINLLQIVPPFKYFFRQKFSGFYF